MLKITIGAVEESITNLYDRVAEFLGRNSDDLRYDCRKIEVSSDISEAIEKFYGNTLEFSMSWLCFGPKLNDTLNNGEVIVHGGFFVFPVSECNAE